MLVTKSSFAKSFAWRSKKVDPTGFIWMGARYYDPTGGRFLSPDPVGYPLCLDLYAFANGDPINYIDHGRFASAAYQTVSPVVIGALTNPRVHGCLRAVAGLGEATVGATFTLATSGAGAILGGVVLAHGLDNFQAGLSQTFSGQIKDPATVQLLQMAGMSHNKAHFTNDFGMLIATGSAAAIPKTSISRSPVPRKSNFITLYRAVKSEELMDIQKTGILRNLGSAEGKYFTTSIEGASSYAKQAVKGFGDPPYTLIKTQASKKIFEGLSPAIVDRGIPAWVIPNEKLEGLIPEILIWMTIPK